MAYHIRRSHIGMNDDTDWYASSQSDWNENSRSFHFSHLQTCSFKSLIKHFNWINAAAVCAICARSKQIYFLYNFIVVICNGVPYLNTHIFVLNQTNDSFEMKIKWMCAMSWDRDFSFRECQFVKHVLHRA